MSNGRWLMSNSRMPARSCKSPRLARRYRSPNEQCGYLALSVARTMSIRTSPNAEAFLAGIGYHALVPRWIPNDVHISFRDAGHS